MTDQRKQAPPISQSGRDWAAAAAGARDKMVNALRAAGYTSYLDESNATFRQELPERMARSVVAGNTAGSDALNDEYIMRCWYPDVE